MFSFLAVAAAYLVGSISFAIVASWLFRLPDPRGYGSGNPGATNVLRSGKKIAALVTLLGDVAKGLLVVWVVRYGAPQLGFAEPTIAACAVAVFLGHLYPIYFRFKGGKGVATALGVVLGLSAWVALLALAAFLLTVLASRYVSLASIVAAFVAAVSSMALFGWGAYAGAIAIISALIVWRHRANIHRLAAGTESRLGRSAPPAT